MDECLNVGKNESNGVINMSPRIGIDLNQILQAAAEIADSQGLEEITLASLAKKLNIKTPSLYNHIDGLPGLKTQLAIYGLKIMYEQLTLAVVGISGDEAVRELAKAFLQFVREHPGLYQATLQAPDSQVTEWKEIADKIVNLNVKVLQVYELDEQMAIHAVRGLRSMMHGFASLEQNKGFGLPLDLDESFALLVDTFIAGIHKYRRKE